MLGMLDSDRLCPVIAARPQSSRVGDLSHTSNLTAWQAGKEMERAEAWRKQEVKSGICELSATIWRSKCAADRMNGVRGVQANMVSLDYDKRTWNWDYLSHFIPRRASYITQPMDVAESKATIRGRPCPEVKCSRSGRARPKSRTPDLRSRIERAM
jgi:hypothetical protein